MIRHIAAAAALLLSALTITPPAQAATLTVNTTANTDAADDACSLAEAITAINQGANQRECTGSAYGSNDRIEFKLPVSGLGSIVLATALPDVLKPVVIDGLTQPGSNCTSWPPTLNVELDGLGTQFRGLIFGPGSDGSVVRGLVIGGMASTGDNFSAGIMLRSNGNRVECNYLGMRADGVTANPNRRGLDINSASDNIVGTDGVQPALGRRNLISGNVFAGVVTRGNAPSRNVIAGNYIGVDASGTLSRSNLHGVSINGAGNGSTAVDNVIGYSGTGTPEFARNIISGNTGGAAVLMEVNVERTRIAGNFIGLDAAGNAAVGNGVGISIGSNASVRNNIIGFASGQPLAVSGNVISGNLGNGVEINGFNGTDLTFIVGNLLGTFPSGAPGRPNGGAAIGLFGGTRALVNGNVISGHTLGVRLVGASNRTMSTLLNATALPGGGAPLDSRDNCLTGNTTGASASLNGSAAATPVFENNWWGAANGPTGAGGNGDAIAGSLDVTPFLAAAPSGCAITNVADLAVELVAFPATLTAGQAHATTLAITNAGPDAATSVQLRFDVPPSTTFTLPVGCALVEAGSAVSCTGASLAAGGRAEFALGFALAADATGTFAITPSVSSSTLDPNAGNNSLIATRDIWVQSAMSVAITNVQSTLTEGTTTDYHVRGENVGPSQVTGASVVMAAPAGLRSLKWYCSPANGATCPAMGYDTIAASVTLPPGGSVDFLVTAEVDEVANVTLAANIGLPMGVIDANPSNNADSDTRPVVKVNDLRLSFETTADTVQAGDEFVFTVVVFNNGPSRAVDARLSLPLPSGLGEMLWTCSVTGGGSCTAAGSGSIDDTITLSPGAVMRYEISTIAGSAGQVTIDAMIAAAGPTDPDTSQNAVSYTLTVTPEPPPAIFADGFESVVSR